MAESAGMNVPEAVDELQDLEAPNRMPRPWTALRRGPKFRGDNPSDSLPPITAARFRRQRKARAEASAEAGQGQRKPMKVTRHHSLRQPGDDSERYLENSGSGSNKYLQTSRPDSAQSRSGRSMTNVAQTQEMYRIQRQTSNRSQYESDSDFIGSSESSYTHDTPEVVIDEICSTSAKLSSEIMEMIQKTSTDAIPSDGTLPQRARQGLRRSVSLNERSGSAYRRLNAKVSTAEEVTKEIPRGPPSSASRPYSAWTEYSKASRPISTRHANGGMQDGQSGHGLHGARDSNVYEHEYINNDHLDGWSDDDDSDWSSDDSWEGLDSGYENDNENDLELVSNITKRGGRESRMSRMSRSREPCHLNSTVAKDIVKDANNYTSDAQVQLQDKTKDITMDNVKSHDKTKSETMDSVKSQDKANNKTMDIVKSQDKTNNKTMDIVKSQDKATEKPKDNTKETRPITARSRSVSRNASRTPQTRSRSNPPSSRANLTPSQSGMRVEDWLVTCREQRIKPLTCLPDIKMNKNSPC